MIKELAKSIREYKKYAILTPVLMIGEVVLEVIIPFVIAQLVNQINDNCDIKTILRYGGVLFVCACISLAFGGVGGFTAAKAGGGFGKNLRKDLYYRIQDYSFENIDRFSTSSLVTRMTTDVNNVQMAFMMIIRIAIRAPLMMAFAIVMAFVMGGKLSFLFIVVMPILAGGLLIIGMKALPSFRRVFKKYDKLNESIEENVMSIRAVKGFAREGYEKEKFKKSFFGRDKN